MMRIANILTPSIAAALSSSCLVYDSELLNEGLLDPRPGTESNTGPELVNQPSGGVGSAPATGSSAGTGGDARGGEPGSGATSSGGGALGSGAVSSAGGSTMGGAGPQTECNFPLSDCDASDDNGCETHAWEDPLRCGGCLSTDPNQGDGVTCTPKLHSTVTCDSGTCAWECEPGWQDTDLDLLELPSNGCETALTACEAPYETGTYYVVGSRVSRDEKNWECNDADCRNKNCAPGVPCAWGQPWDELGSCWVTL